MRTWKLLLLAGVAISLSTTAFVGQRSVRLSTPAPTAETLAPFDVNQSAALFVGVSEFNDTSVDQIRYTVDDAIALAYAFTLERRINLVRPERVALALTGDPKKAISRERLARLRVAGADITAATQQNVSALLERQAREAGKGGVFIVFFASHGFSVDGNGYVLASTSQLRQRDTALSTAHVLDVVARSAAQRSLVLIDACRERLPGKRGSKTDSTYTAPLIEQMNAVAGQVLFYAASPGGVSYEDQAYGHGVFTQAILEGLACGAKAPRGTITVETLSQFVEEKVAKWVRKNRDPSVLKATQVSMDPYTKSMPLAQCSVPPSPLRVAFENDTVTAFGPGDLVLWRATVPGRIASAQAVDLDMDKANEIVAGDEHGNIVAFDPVGGRLWSVSTHAPIRKIAVEHLYNRKNREIVAISDNDTGSRLTIVGNDGTELAAYSYAGRLQDLIIGSIDARHKPKSS